ncbi:MAG: hypothetical protein ABSB12_04100, partial [Candidatus Saccharimonadales bacterium]
MPPDENQNSNSHTNSLDPTATTQSQPAINYVSSPPAIVLQPKSYKKYLLFFSLAIILIILGVVLLVGHFKPDKVTISSKNTQSTLSTSTSTNIAWDTFNNGHITFKYPANWTVTDGSSSYNLLSLDGINTQQNDGQYVLAVNVDSPSIKPTVALPGDSPQYGKITSLSIGLSISALGTEEDAPSSGLLI